MKRHEVHLRLFAERRHRYAEVVSRLIQHADRSGQFDLHRDQ